MGGERFIFFLHSPPQHPTPPPPSHKKYWRRNAIQYWTLVLVSVQITNHWEKLDDQIYTQEFFNIIFYQIKQSWEEKRILVFVLFSFCFFKLVEREIGWRLIEKKRWGGENGTITKENHKGDSLLRSAHSSW